MPIIYLKNNKKNRLVIERKLYTKSYSLELDKRYCVICEVCQIICPVSAIKIEKNNTPTTRLLKIDFDVRKCIYCGACVALCPFGALTLKIDGKIRIPVVENGVVPPLIHNIVIDNLRCSIAHLYIKENGCVECEKACPFKLIKIDFKENGETDIKVDKVHCPGCQICVSACPYALISVRKIFQGIIKINNEKCPEGCHLCFDVCPIKSTRKSALYFSNGKIYVNEQYCVYCGACKLICPVNDAITFQRIFILHNYVKSGTWNFMLERLTSHKNLVLEMRNKKFLQLSEFLSALKKL